MNRTRLLILCASLIAASTLSADPVTGGATALAFDGPNLATLSSFFTFGVVPPTTVTVTDGVPTAIFPITGGDTATGIFIHSGGLTLTGSNTSKNVGVTATIENLVVNLQSSTVTAEAILTGGTPLLFPAFNVGSGGLWTISSTLGSFYTEEYGLPDLTGQTFGTATNSPTVAAAAPEPSSVALLGLGFCATAAGLTSLKRNRRPSVLLEGTDTDGKVGDNL